MTPTDRLIIAALAAAAGIRPTADRFVAGLSTEAAGDLVAAAAAWHRATYQAQIETNHASLATLNEQYKAHEAELAAIYGTDPRCAELEAALDANEAEAAEHLAQIFDLSRALAALPAAA